MLILASSSPRRKILLKRIVDNFTIIPSNTEEYVPEDTPIDKIPLILSEQKAKSVFYAKKLCFCSKDKKKAGLATRFFDVTEITS